MLISFSHKFFVMKKLLILFSVLFISTVAFCQDSSTMKKKDHSMMNHKMMGDCVMMKDGKMMEMKGGKTMSMDKDMTMGNGTVVMTDGTVKMKDGTTKTLADGECVYMSGKMSKMGDKMDKMNK